MRPARYFFVIQLSNSRVGDFESRGGLPLEMYGLRPSDYGSQTAGGEKHQRSDKKGSPGIMRKNLLKRRKSACIYRLSLIK